MVLQVVPSATLVEGRQKAVTNAATCGFTPDLFLHHVFQVNAQRLAAELVVQQ